MSRTESQLEAIFYDQLVDCSGSMSLAQQDGFELRLSEELGGVTVRFLDPASRRFGFQN